MHHLITVLLPLILLATAYLGPGAAVNAAADIEWAELYADGAAYSAFMEDVERRTSMWEANTANAAIDEEVLERASAVGGTWHLLAVAVDGCSDSVNTIPYIARLAELVDGMDLRIIDSKVGDGIMMAHRTPDGRPATPTVAVLDSLLSPIGVWVERPAPLQDWAMESRSSMSQREFAQEKQLWYDEDLGSTTVEEIVALIEAAASE